MIFLANSYQRTRIKSGLRGGSYVLLHFIVTTFHSLFYRLAAEARACTGVRGIHEMARDIKIDNFSVTFHGANLLQDTKLELSSGNRLVPSLYSIQTSFYLFNLIQVVIEDRNIAYLYVYLIIHRYGFIGENGCGKSTLLAVLGNREVPIQDHIDIYYLAREMPASEKTALECVKEADEERIKLEKLAEELAASEDDEAQDYLMQIYERLDDLGTETAEAKAAHILHGLQFTPAMQQKKCKDFSGGWRMRVALARALFLKPHLLLLDEPTNHLDLEACVWLEEELKNYPTILLIISHSQDFLNGVCNNILHLEQKQLKTYGGNYDTFIRTKSELEEAQMKQYNWEQDQIAHMKNYIARFGHGSAKLARQAQSKEKTLAKMVAEGLTEKVASLHSVSFNFLSCGEIPPPVIMVENVSFRYNENTEYIYKNLEFGCDLDTRLALVGPNGAGKSTLLKLIYGELIPTQGMIRRHNHLKMARYHQHMHEILEMDLSPLDYMLKCFPHIKERDEMRKVTNLTIII